MSETAAELATRVLQEVKVGMVGTPAQLTEDPKRDLERKASQDKYIAKLVASLANSVTSMGFRATSAKNGRAYLIAVWPLDNGDGKIEEKIDPETQRMLDYFDPATRPK